ncbi:MAG TPA: tetratricopeptide repeat protein [Gemmatimonadales bacterium]|nr:tetratricopeptide repeat protein [Gemmatimonadales bacterium]
MAGGPALSERDLAVLRSFARRIDPSDAGAHNNLGVLYYQKSLIAEAIAEFTRALELDPKMQVAQANLEIAYRNTGYYDRRVAELSERLRRTPDDGDAHWELGRTYASLGHHEDAIREFEAMLVRNPDDVPTMIHLGLALKASGRLDEASERFGQAREKDPESSLALFYFGEALYNRGLPDQARAILQECVGLNPDNADAHYLLAFLYGDLGQHEAARAATKRAIALNPTFARAQTNLSLRRRTGATRVIDDQALELRRPSLSDATTLAHYNLGLAFRQKGYYVEALREYRLALESGEDRRLTLQAMAEVQLLRRELGAALELYESLVVEFPDSPKLFNERGVCLHQAGRRKEANESYRKAVELDKNYALAWNNLGVLQSHGDSGEDALEAFHQALRCKRDLVTAHLNLGLLLLQRRRLQLSLEAYRQVLGDHPANAIAWNGVGLVLTELKRYPDARNAFVRAVEGDPENASAHYNLSFTLSQVGDFDGALKETKRALELEPFYVPQKYALTIDLQYEDPTIAIVPEISADVAVEEVGEDFAFDQRLLDQVFRDLAPPVPAEPTAAAGEDLLAFARECINKGLLDRASAELDRALARGAPYPAAAILAGHIFARRGLHGEALERYREARVELGTDDDATLGEVKALLALGRAREAGPLAEELVKRRADRVEVLVAVSKTRLANGNPVGALDLVKEAQIRAPGRPDLLQLQARIAVRLGELSVAIAAYHSALELDNSLAQVWCELGELEEKREKWDAARAAYERALDLLPTFVEAALALADLQRRTEALPAAIEVLVALLYSDPLELDALQLLGRTLLDDGRPERALEAFGRILKYDPNHTGAMYYAGVALTRMRRYNQAVQLWERVVQADPTSSFAQLARNETRSARDLQHILSRAS